MQAERRRYLGVIPARGGSEGVPRKNLAPIGGQALVLWSLRAARASGLDRWLVSSDDSEILDLCEAEGAETLVRPPALAGADARTVDALAHALEATGDPCDAIVVLQPTSPLRSPGLIDRCIAHYEATGADNLATGSTLKARAFGSYDHQRRQDYEGFFYDDGSVYILDRALVCARRWSGDRIARFPTQPWENFEIDTPFDLWLLDMLLRQHPACAWAREELKG